MSEENGEWPEAVLERIKPYAERLEKTVEQGLQDFTDWLVTEWSVATPNDEDDFYLVQWAEQFVTETRNLGTGGGSGPETQTYVGCIIAVDERIVDMRAKQKSAALSKYDQNSGRAIEDGQIGIVTAKNGVWHVNGEATKERVDGTKLPWFAIEHADQILCLLNTFQASEYYGKPIGPSSELRTLHFLGNTEGNFTGGIIQWQISVSGDAMTHAYNIGQPCKVQARQPKEIKEGREHNLYANKDFHKTLSYTNDFVDENLQKELNPDRFLINTKVHNEYVDLGELEEQYEARKVPTWDKSGYYCPIIITKGYVSRMNKEPKASEWDKTGRNFSLSITSPSLQVKYGRDANMSEIPVWVSGTLMDEGHPFDFQNSNGEWRPFAERTQVIVIGRIKKKLRDDGTAMYSLGAQSIYTPPRTARPAATGGDTSLDQFGGEQ